MVRDFLPITRNVYQGTDIYIYIYVRGAGWHDPPPSHTFGGFVPVRTHVRPHKPLTSEWSQDAPGCGPVQNPPHRNLLEKQAVKQASKQARDDTVSLKREVSLAFGKTLEADLREALVRSDVDPRALSTLVWESFLNILLCGCKVAGIQGPCDLGIAKCPWRVSSLADLSR